MHRFAFLALALILVVLQSCVNNPAGRSPKQRHALWDRSQPSQYQLTLKHTIVRDALGGAIIDSVAGQDFDLSASSAAKISINVPSESTTRDFDESYAIEDIELGETLTISVLGNIEERNSSSGGRALAFASTLIVFEFDGFAFENSCGGRSVITGRIECRVGGTYSRTTQKMSGSATCVTGSFRGGEPLVYLYDMLEGEGEEYRVSLAVNTRINGDAFDLESYSFFGRFMIDEQIISIPAVIDAEHACLSDE